MLACWPNGKAFDFESKDYRFDPCAGRDMFLGVFLTFFFRVGSFGLLMGGFTGEKGIWSILVNGRGERVLGFRE